MATSTNSSAFSLIITSPEGLERVPSNHSQLTLRNDEVDSEPISTKYPSWRERFHRHMLEELDSPGTRLPLALCCFLSGFVACVAFSACSIWVGFQSGNSVQVALALSRLAYDPHLNIRHFRTSDYQALISVVAFAVAAQVGGRLSPWKRKSRATISNSAFLQFLLTVGAAVTNYYCKEPAFSLNRAEPSWHDGYGLATIGLLSASFGLQGVVGEVLGTGYTATVVLTSIWVQLAILPSPKQWSKPRDDRIFAVLLFCTGAFVSRLLLARIGSHGTLAVAAGIRLMLIPLWLFYCQAASEDVFLPVSATKEKKPLQLINSNDSRATVVNVAQTEMIVDR